MLSKLTGVAAATAVGVSATVAGAQSAAVQWRVEDGGNGHWYEKHGPYSTWQHARDDAVNRGGHLMTITTQGEWSFAFANIPAQPNGGTVLGGYQLPDSPEPGVWVWVTGEPWADFIDFTRFDDCPGGPGGACGSSCYLQHQQDYLYYGWFGGSNPNQWFDDCGGNFNADCGSNPRWSIVEWSADCNSDGIVDYGQIIAGDLPDTDSNGIPDVCEVPSCADADLNPNGIVDGADLGAMLAFWGPVSPAFPRADINGDGNVNGADLGILLSLWGPCGG
jgi:hypothetical protein